MSKRPKGFGSSPYYNLSPENISDKTLRKWFRKANSGDVAYQIKYTNFFRHAWNKASYQPDATMIHEKDYQPMFCCICGVHMPSIHDTHNPSPVKPSTTAKQALENNSPHRCCSKCNQQISRERLAAALKSDKTSYSFPIFDFFTTYDPITNQRIGSNN